MKWNKVKLTEISKPKQWKNLPISELSSEGYAVYGANGIIGRYKEYNHEFATLAITCRGATCGTINITEPKSYITSNAMALDDISEDVDQKFLYYALNKRGFKDVITGAAQPQITREGLSKIILNIPESKEYQLHIANLLSKAENLIAQRKESIRLLDEFLKSTFWEMFGDPALNKKGWETLTIRELALRFSDGPFGSNLKTEHYSNSGIQVIRLQNIGINEFVEKDITYVKTNHYENVLKKYSCYPGDVVIATMGEPNIRACIVPKHVNVAVNKADCVLFRVNPKLSNPFYISHLLNLDGFLFLANSFIHGQTRARISSGQIAKISIPIPHLELQSQFAQIVEKTEAIKTQYQQSLQELENLYGSLSQRAFRGEIGIKDEGLLSSAERSLSEVEVSRSMAAEPNTEYKSL